MGGLFGGGSTMSASEPRIGALRVQTSSYGAVIPLVYGRQRISANLIWYGDYIPISHTTSTRSGGKAGITQVNTTYTYQTGLIMGLCEGSIIGIGSVWKGKNKFSNLLDAGGMVEFFGADGQAAWSHLQSNHLAQAVPYSGLAYVAHASYALGGNAQLDNHSFEVKAIHFPNTLGIFDVNPSDVVLDFLTHATHGVGFPLNKLAAMQGFSDYCDAMGLFVSPAFTQQKAAQAHLIEFVHAVNAEFVFSEGLLKIIPRADMTVTGNGVTYTPNITPDYDLTDVDFLDGSELICRRTLAADAFNSVQIEFVDRSNHYNIAIASASDQANIEQYGLRQEGIQKMHFICDAAVAQMVAQLRLQRILYIRNTYDFQLGWNYARLEPMDIVTITDVGLGLDRYPVRIESLEEDVDGAIRVVANEFHVGVADASPYSFQSSSGFSAGFNVLPSMVNAPLMIEPPLALTHGINELWIAASGATNWGGCSVWMSLDNASFERIGMINGAARYGVLNAALPAPAANPDVLNHLNVTLNADGQILALSQAAVDSGASLVEVGGELLAYRDASLVATRQYDVSYLNRGLHGSMTAAHPLGTAFVMLDQALLHHAFQSAQIGQTIFFKFTSFNPFGLQEQSLADVTVYNRTLTGGIPSGPANLGLQQPFVGLFAKMQWSVVAGATSYDVEMWHAGILRDTYNTTSTTFTYALSNSILDGGPWRDYTVKVRSVSGLLKSGWSQININNPSPAVPGNIVVGTVTANSIALSWNAIADVDMQDYQIWISTTAGFTPSPATLAATVTTPNATISGLTTATIYYIKLAARDQWGTATLNYSAEIMRATN